jgi:hypothetical protein
MAVSGINRNIDNRQMEGINTSFNRPVQQVQPQQPQNVNAAQFNQGMMNQLATAPQVNYNQNINSGFDYIDKLGNAGVGVAQNRSNAVLQGRHNTMLSNILATQQNNQTRQQISADQNAASRYQTDSASNNVVKRLAQQQSQYDTTQQQQQTQFDATLAANTSNNQIRNQNEQSKIQNDNQTRALKLATEMGDGLLAAHPSLTQDDVDKMDEESKQAILAHYVRSGGKWPSVKMTGDGWFSNTWDVQSQDGQQQPQQQVAPQQQQQPQQQDGNTTNKFIPVAGTDYLEDGNGGYYRKQ